MGSKNTALNQTRFSSRLKRLVSSFLVNRNRELFTRLIEQTFDVRSHLVDPKEIRFVSHSEFPRHPICKIADGDWDRLTAPFEELPIYKAMAAVFREGKKWEETDFYRQGKPQEQASRIEALQNMHQEMSEIGYINNVNFDQISVAVGREGDLLLVDGKQRLGIAKVLDIPRISVRIVARHPEWVQFKKEILDYALRNRNKLYAPLTHPDLDSIPSKWDGERRFEIIRHHMLSSKGTLLDIGCHWGYFCHRFESLGFDCTGVEMSPENLVFLKKLKRAGNKNFRISETSITGFLKEARPEYDVILALAVLHHLVQSEEKIQELKMVLSTLRAREMFFLPHDQSDKWMRNAHWNPGETEFVDFITRHSHFKTAVRIGSAGHGRSLYRLT